MRKKAGKKIAIPSDPAVRPPAFSIIRVVLANPHCRTPEGTWQIETLANFNYYADVSLSFCFPLRFHNFPVNQKTSNKTSRDRTWLFPTKLAHSSIDKFGVN